jgi:hypothetical protein
VRLDEEKIIDLETKGRDLGILWVVEPCLPFGLATWRTTGAVRDIRVRRLGQQKEPLMNADRRWR